MEEIEFENQLLEAIKQDDLKSFSLLMPTNSNLNLCYGRFPILTLLYMYSSFKILSKFEKELMPIHNFKVVEERVVLYKDFRRFARKTLRLFDANEIVYPIQMLAVLDERVILKNNFKFLYKSVEILQKIENIYKLNHKTQVVCNVDGCDIPLQKLTKAQRVASWFISIVLCVVVGLSAIFMVFVQKTNGLGVKDNPIKISTAEELELALKKDDRYYMLKNDITISGLSVESFAGTIDGAGHVLNIVGELNVSLIKNLTGSVLNLQIKLNNNKMKITQNSAIISEKNAGKIENCSIIGDFNQEFNAEGDVFVGLFVAENQGLISKCRAKVSGVMTNTKQSNAYAGLFVGLNSEKGEIVDCVAESGIVLADTVDVAGIVGQNNGKISSTENKAKLAQTSSKQWHPNVAGIALLNYGTIDACLNSGELNSKSEVSEKEENPYYVFVAGIACENYGSVLNAINTGGVCGIGNISNVVAAGICAQNIKDEKHEGLVKYSVSKSNTKAFSELGQVCAGGVVGINSSVILNSGCVGTIDANSNSTQKEAIFMNELDKALAVVSGGVVAVNQSAEVQSCYADVGFVCGEASAEILKIYSGVIGSIGMYRYTYETIPLISLNYPSAYVDIRYNFYVDKTEIKQCAYGVFVTLDDEGYYKSGVAEIISELGNENLMKKCATFEEIPEEVRVYA